MNNNGSALSNSLFVIDTIKELLDSGRVVERNKNELIVINPLSVSVQSSGKKRLILDLRYINKFILKKKFRFEDYRKALEYFRQGGYASKFDLKSGYHHIDIFPSHRDFLGFSWIYPDGSTRFFSYTVLPFGLSTAPYIFTKVLRPLVKYWRTRGFYCVVYLDDGLSLESTLDKAQFSTHHIRGDLLAAGFVINEEKSIWSPVQIISWLGVVWDFELGTISISGERISKLENKLKIALANPVMSCRQLASITGSIISLSPVFGNYCRFLTRHCQITIVAAQSWESEITLDFYCISELEFWLKNVRKLNSKDCFKAFLPSHCIYADASAVACGAYISTDNSQICHRLFTEDERRSSSTHRELLAIEFSLESFVTLVHRYLIYICYSDIWFLLKEQYRTVDS